MANWFLENIVGILGTIMGGFIAYHVYFLSKKIDLRDKLVQKNTIREQVETLLRGIAGGLRRDVEVVNAKKYMKHYPTSNELNKDGYTYLRAELKALRFDGVEFFCGSPQEAYRRADSSFSLRKDSDDQETLKVFPVGLIPYEWIIYIDPQGDEFSYRPQFFTYFKGLKKYPYKYLVYYSESGTYSANNDPIDMRWRRVDIK